MVLARLGSVAAIETNNAGSKSLVFNRLIKIEVIRMTHLMSYVSFNLLFHQCMKYEMYHCHSSTIPKKGGGFRGGYLNQLFFCSIIAYYFKSYNFQVSFF